MELRLIQEDGIDGFCIQGCDGACCCVKNGTEQGGSRRLSWSYPQKEADFHLPQLVMALAEVTKSWCSCPSYKGRWSSWQQREHSQSIILPLSIDNQKYVTSHNFLLTDRAFSRLFTWYNMAVFQNVRGHYLKHLGPRKATCSCEQCMKFF